MKKLTLIIAIVFSGILMQAQIKGIDFSEAIKVTPETSPDTVYNRLVVYDDTYIILYKYNTVGAVHSHRKILSILEDNNQDFDKPSYDNSYFNSGKESYDDYQMLQLSVQLGNSVVVKKWEINGYEIAWILDDEKYGIYMYAIKE